MSFQILLTLSSVGSEAGPFDIFSNVDNYVVPVDVNVSTEDITTGYYYILVPNGTTTIKVKSVSGCVNSIFINISGLP